MPAAERSIGLPLGYAAPSAAATSALAETVIGLYKTEVIHRRSPWRSLQAVELATLEWVAWFNHRRLLEPIGFVLPAEAETAFYRALESQPLSQRRTQTDQPPANPGRLRWIDDGGLKGRAATREAVCEMHRRFCELLPDDLLWVEDPETGTRERVIPGELRRKHVRVGARVAVSPEALPTFLERFEEAYGHLGRNDSIVAAAAAAAHHRLLWIHPFIDGNGRVARLMSHAMLLDTLDTGGIWSGPVALPTTAGRTRAIWPTATCHGGMI
jgi:hypothetical protein